MNKSSQRINELKNVYEISKYLHELDFKFNNCVWSKENKSYYEYTNVFLICLDSLSFSLSSKDGILKLEELIQFENLVKELLSFQEIEVISENTSINVQVIYTDNGFYFNPFENPAVSYDYNLNFKLPSKINIPLVFIDKNNRDKLSVTVLNANKKESVYQISSFPDSYLPNTNLLLVPKEIGSIQGLR
jgi:hypothetical protein